MDDAPPPTDHTIRPHHLLVLTALLVAFKDSEIKRFPPEYALHIHRVLLYEISEVAPHRTHQDLLNRICSGPGADAPDCLEFIDAVQHLHNDLKTPDKMGNFFQNLPGLYQSPRPHDEHNTKLYRRSLFGFFCRRSYVSFVKLSFSGLVKLCKDYQAWCAGHPTAGYEAHANEELTSDFLIYKTQADKKAWARPEPFDVWEHGEKIGDENIATENLRRFFEQHFHEQGDSGVRQHALLNLVRMHYIHGEYGAVRTLLLEAINSARNTSDKITLHHCTSILQRLPPERPGEKPLLNEIQPDLHPLEVFYDVSKLLDEKHEQPLSAAFVKIYQAIGLYDHWLDVQFALPVEDQQWAQHAVQSIIWKMGGCDKLAHVEEDIVLAFTETSGESTNRLTVLLNRAYWTARQGRYNEGLAILLEPSTWAALSIREYNDWAHYIWDILMMRATRRGQTRLVREYFLTQRPSGAFNPKEYLFGTGWDSSSSIRDLLHRFLQLRECDQAVAGVEQLLKALWQSEFLCRFSLYRTAIILLADIGLELGINKRSRQILEEILPQIIDGDDLEQRAVGCFTFGRCIIAAESSTAAGLEEALPYLLMAETDFRTLEIYPSLADVQYMLSVVYHNLGREQEGIDAAKRHSDTVLIQQQLEVAPVEGQILELAETIGQVGVALASR